MPLKVSHNTNILLGGVIVPQNADKRGSPKPPRFYLVKIIFSVQAELLITTV